MAVILSTRVKSLLRTSSSSRLVWSWSSPWLLRRRRVGGMAGGDDSFQPDSAPASGKLWMNYTNRKLSLYSEPGPCSNSSRAWTPFCYCYLNEAITKTEQNASFKRPCMFLALSSREREREGLVVQVLRGTIENICNL